MILISDRDLVLHVMHEGDLPRVIVRCLEQHVRAFWDNDEDPPVLTADLIDAQYRPLRLVRMRRRGARDEGPRGCGGCSTSKIDP